MRESLLPLLACPDCGGDLGLRPERSAEPGAWIAAGKLSCGGCGRDFPIAQGIPRLYPKGSLEAAVQRTQKSFAWEWLRYPGSMPEDRPTFLEETQLPESEWTGKLTLDAGCGMGRYARVARSLGARLVAFDLSDSIVRLVQQAAEDPDLHLVQGDLLHPPFKPAVFDVAYSQGVLHHTRSTSEAFARVAALVKPGGCASIWVYGRPSSWASFSTNPLRTGRTWLKSVLPLVWLIVWARMLASDGLRALTTRLPVPVLYALCYPITCLGAVPLLKYLTFSVHPDFRVRLIENFDWLAPPFQYKHTKEELDAWFRAAGFEPLKRLAHGVVPKPGLLGRRQAPPRYH
ncbi:MAG: methyltransferase domain-containing protein [Elusimicrobia bacterium]|nr:methyltransferase domain-containing protein [Elusimicrobiota bacterium]